MRHVVMFSGGVGSWAAASRVRAAIGDDPMVALFADTKMEDPDLYRFIREAASDVRATLVTIADGRTPWDLFDDESFIGNTRVDICSRVLKRDLLRKWLVDNCDPADTNVYLGIDWSEVHRFENAQLRWEPWKVAAPLVDPPLTEKSDLLVELKRHGIAPPLLYVLGFAHNNCGGACVKAGQAQWAHLLRMMPDRYAEHEAREQAFRDRTGKDVAIPRDRCGGTTKPLTLAALRHRIELNERPTMEWGGCGCAID